MRLKSIRLTGFKSFVDATSVHFPSNLSAVVGPNGCGKSNIIDAVRWVMGESSAKNLRGESMADVIFNGSSGRKPVAQAAIELIFDNADGSLGGEYAAFSEIAVRRMVTRDGRSDYFLNGSRCRRKDITDIFLGTGLGPRSYAIIEQGMISRLIEAKPEELRVYIEEAAGISRYKDRRRDTELRMRHTRDNLDRLNDLREELARQLQHLERQAQAAEKYRELKDEELRLRVTLQALRWRQQEQIAAAETARLGEEEVAVAALMSQRQTLLTWLEGSRLERTQQADAVQQAQQQHYRLGHELATVQQSLQHRRERLLQIAQDLQDADARYQQMSEHAHNDAEELREVGEQLAELMPELGALQRQGQQGQDALQAAEADMQRWQQSWEAFQEATAQHTQQAELQQMRLQQIEQSQKRTHERRARLEAEQMHLPEQVDEAAFILQEQIAELDLRQEEAQEQVQALALEMQQQRGRIQAQEGELDAIRRQLQEQQGALIALQSLQDEALACGPSSQAWLADHGLQHQRRLLDDLQVTPAWQRAVETALAERLRALQMDGFAAVTDWSEVPSALALLAQGADWQAMGEDDLAHEVQPLAARALLWGWRKSPSLAQALLQRGDLSPGQVWVTADAVMVGAHFIQWPTRTAADGLIERQQRLQQMQAECEQLQKRKTASADLLQALQQRLPELEAARDDAHARMGELARERGIRLADLRARQVRDEQQQARRQRIRDELSEVRQQEESDAIAHEQALAQKEAALAAMLVAADQRTTLLAQRDAKRAQVDALRDEVRARREQMHQLDVQRQSLSTRQHSLERSLERAQEQRQALADRRDALREEEMQAQLSPQHEEARLHELAEAQEQAHQRWLHLREVLAAHDEAIQARDGERLQCERHLQGRQEGIAALRLRVQEAQTRMQAVQEQLQEQGAELAMGLDQLDETPLDEAAMQAQIERVAARIQRLGPINLAAIDEYRQQLERKTYLDHQDADLREALEMLENAIRKIDRETRTLFKDTFDRVNQGFAELFPKVFGGGHAYLELTGDDLLEAGVAIMARPPGKRNSTIHLLSGGEKALTALSLVFSIFALNPAPFCMLDEVDAPLDDANVARFARLVEEMSQRLQFIYITHNKIAMEMAHQLMGVTMHEPGVSRLVAVNVEEAARMAAQ